MARVRGIAVHAAMRFVADSWGAAAHQRVLEALPAENCGTFLGPLEEGSWKPLEDLGVYLETARLLFAQDDPEFYRRVGRFVGRHEREHGGFKPMVADSRTSIRLATLVWKALYDSGRCEVQTLGPQHAVMRVSDFPTSRGICLTLAGGIEGLATSETETARAQETACRLDGNPFCEFSVSWE